MIRVRGTSRGVPYPKVEGFTVIPAWSRGAAPWKELSPFELKIDGVIFENYWQACKVYDKVRKQTREWKWPEETHGEPNETWVTWHRALCAHPYPIRRPNGKEVPLYAWYMGEKLDVIQARKKIYIPIYQQLLRAHPTYQKLLAMYKEGKHLIIVEPDGPSPEEYPDGMEVTMDKLIELQDVTVRSNGKYHPYGHGYVIALTLLEDS